MFKELGVKEKKTSCDTSRDSVSVDSKNAEG